MVNEVEDFEAKRENLRKLQMDAFHKGYDEGVKVTRESLILEIEAWLDVHQDRQWEFSTQKLIEHLRETNF